MTLILISAMALVLTQCTAKPAKRTHENTVGFWIGFGAAETGDTAEAAGLIAGVNIKRFPKDFYNASFNANSGILIGAARKKTLAFGIVADAGFNLLSDDLYRKEFWLDGTFGPGTQAFQFYGGPSLGVHLIMSKKGELWFNPTIGALAGMSMLFPPYRKYPESDLSFEGTLHTNIKDLILKSIKGKSNEIGPDYLRGGMLYNLYLY